jgi:orotate phosphoribosyltransferase
MVAIFTYGFKIARDNFKEAKVPLKTLSDYNQLIEVALNTGYIKKSDLETLNHWRDTPDIWGK